MLQLQETRSADYQSASAPTFIPPQSRHRGHGRKIRRCLFASPASSSRDHSNIAEDGDSLLDLRSLMTPLEEALQGRPTPENDCCFEGASGAPQHIYRPVTPTFGQTEENWLCGNRNNKRSPKILNRDVLPTSERDTASDTLESLRDEV
ncbi:hypothetical protein MTO96_042639 [Rhipicephalus appendiculatus]